MKQRDLAMLGLAAIFGFVGGAIFNGTHQVVAASAGTVRATRFELVSASGKPLAFLGPDTERNIVLAFIQKDGKKLATVGVINGGSAFLSFAGTDGVERVALRVGVDERPFLGMGDEKRSGRIQLGYTSTDTEPEPENERWGLLFGAPAIRSPLAGIGYSRDPVDGKLRGELWVVNKAGNFWEPRSFETPQAARLRLGNRDRKR